VKRLAQNVAQPIFCQNLIHYFFRGSKQTTYLGYFCSFKKCPKKANVRKFAQSGHPGHFQKSSHKLTAAHYVGENSSNPVTLVVAFCCLPESVSQ
jgi:hypothetical protein